MVDERHHDPARATDYRAARIASAGALTAVIVLLLIVDAADASYELSPLVLVPILGTILTLLGIEARTIIRGG